MFSKDSTIVMIHTQWSSALTFEKLLRGVAAAVSATGTTIYQKTALLISYWVNPLKNGGKKKEIAHLSTTNSLMFSTYVSQKRNEATENFQCHNTLLNFIL